MKALVLFSLKKRFLNKVAILLNVVLFLVLGFVLNLDNILVTNSETITIINLDNSVADYYEAFLNLEVDGYEYIVSNKEYQGEVAVLHLDEQWTIYSENNLSSEFINQISEDVRTVVLADYYASSDNKTKAYIDEFNKLSLINVSQNNSEEDNTIIQLVLSLSFFLVMSYGMMLANEVAYERSSHTLSLTLTSIDTNQHFLAKILTAYATLFIQLLIIIVFLVIWIIERQISGGLDSLLDLLMASTTTTSVEYDFSLINIIEIGVILFINLLIIQVILMLVIVYFKNSEQASNFQSIYYLILMMVYYVFLINGNSELFLSTFSKVMSYLPITSMIFMPIRIMLVATNLFSVLMCIFINLFTLIIICVFSLPFYKRELLIK